MLLLFYVGVNKRLNLIYNNISLVRNTISVLTTISLASSAMKYIVESTKFRDVYEGKSFQNTKNKLLTVIQLHRARSDCVLVHKGVKKSMAALLLTPL